MKMWSGRFRQPVDPAFERWQRSYPFDQRLLTQELEASAAHARALGACGAVSVEELKRILGGLEEISENALRTPNFLNDADAEDVHHFVEKKLVEFIGDTGYKLHSGRSRNEQIATDLRLYVRESLDHLQLQLTDWLDSILARAEQSGSRTMPAYTHLQRAEPVLIAHWLLAYFEMFSRDADRLYDCRKRVNLCPLGSGAVAGATLALDRQSMSDDLGFDEPTANSIDATCDRDFVIEFVSALSLLASHLSRWAEEMILFSTHEYGFLQSPESYSTGSSAMPQKKNPDLLELTRGKVGRVIGDLNALLITAKGLPLAYNKDLQETQEPLFDAAQTVLSLLPLVTGWMKDVVFNYAHMQEAANSGFTNAWAAATYLVKHGVPFRLAHEQIGKAVQLCLEKQCNLEALTLEELREFNPAFDNDFYSSITLDAVLAIHDVPGGTAPARVKQAWADARQKIADMRGDVHAHA
jgi:argininosuccinate lyase